MAHEHATERKWKITSKGLITNQTSCASLSQAETNEDLRFQSHHILWTGDPTPTALKQLPLAIKPLNWGSITAALFFDSARLPGGA